MVGESDLGAQSRMRADPANLCPLLLTRRQGVHGSRRVDHPGQVMGGRTIRVSGLAFPSAQCAERCAQFFGK